MCYLTPSLSKVVSQDDACHDIMDCSSDRLLMRARPYVEHVNGSPGSFKSNFYVSSS